MIKITTEKALELMDTMPRDWSVIVSVSRGMGGWSCMIMSPDISGTNRANRPTMADAFAAALTAWWDKMRAQRSDLTWPEVFP
jgi:hypothetical protein